MLFQLIYILVYKSVKIYLNIILKFVSTYLITIQYTYYPFVHLSSIYLFYTSTIYLLSMYMWNI